MRHIGFTGTRNGMTIRQREMFGLLLKLYGAEDMFHHGDCVGADREAHSLALTRLIKIHIHPPEDPKARANCEGYTEIAEPKPYLDRNHDIVDACDVLFAMPSSREEEQRSGTWATIRYARKQEKALIVIWPDGATKAEN